MTELEDLQKQFIQAANTDHSPRVRDQWHRIHRMADLDKTRCNLKKEGNWMTAPIEGIECGDCR